MFRSYCRSIAAAVTLCPLRQNTRDGRSHRATSEHSGAERYDLKVTTRLEDSLRTPAATMNPRSRMRRVAAIAVLFVAVLVSGCSLFRSKGDQTVAGPEALNPDLVNPLIFTPACTGKCVRYTDTGVEAKKNYLGAVILDSVHKCQAFINTLALDEGDANYIGDSFATIFSALATVTKPINTVHGLTASATIASGTKNAYLSGYFANATIANFGMVMQTSYLAATRSYVAAMQDLDYSKVIVPAEIAKIESIHSLCSMASAQYNISQTLGQAASKQSTSNIGVQLDFDGKATAKVGDEVVMTATLVNSSGKPAVLSDDMAVSVVASPDTIFSTKGKDFSKSTCDVKSIKAADDGKSLAYQKGAIVQSGNCVIRLSLKASAAGTVSAEIKAAALKTDQGSNAIGTGALSITFGDKKNLAAGAPMRGSPPTTPSDEQHQHTTTNICIPRGVGNEAC